MKPAGDIRCYGESKKIETKARNIIDETNPMYFEPFKHGWKREVVYRRKSNQLCDVYYYPPGTDDVDDGKQRRRVTVELIERQKKRRKQNGKKFRKYSRTNIGLRLRSLVDVAQFLEPSCQKNALTTDNFTFCRRPLGFSDPEREIIRLASIVTIRPINIDSDSEDTSFDKPGSSHPEVAGKTVRVKREGREKAAGVTSSKPLASTQISRAAHSEFRTKQLGSKRTAKTIESFLAVSTRQVHPPFQQKSSATRSQRVMERISKSRSWKPYSASSSALQNIPIATVAPTLKTSDFIMENALVHSFEIPFSSESLMETATKSYISNVQIEGDWTQSQDQLYLPSSPSNKDFDSECGIINIDVDVESKMEPDIELVDVKEFLIQNKGDNEGEVHTFKVYIRQENDPDNEFQIRRFSIQFQDDSIYPQLCETLRDYFELADKNFTLHWKDPDGDIILVTTDMDLREAMSMHRYNPTRLNVTVLNQPQM